MGRYRLLWLEGICWAAIGYDRRAEQTYGSAKRGFERLKLPWEIALCALDLGEILRRLGKWDELVELAIETYSRFEILSGNAQALIALGQWQSAIQARSLTGKITSKARGVIVVGAHKGSCCKRERR